MYTLKRSKDGLLHGPINKKIWGSYASRSEMIKWASEESLRRGFDPAANSNIHIVIDGERILYSKFSEYFKKALFALDIRHLEEKIWSTGRAFHSEGSKELKSWVKNYTAQLYTGKASNIVK